MTSALTRRIAAPMLVTISLACSGSVNTSFRGRDPAIEGLMQKRGFGGP